MSSSEKKKLVMLLSRVPSKLDKGDKLRAFYQIKYLSESYEIFLICLDTEAQWYDFSTLEPYCKEIKLYRITKASRLFNLLKATISGLPFQVAYFYNSRVKKDILQYIQNCQPDHIYSQLIRTAEYVKNIHHIPKTIDYMDAFSKGIERRIKDANWLIKPLFKSENKRLLKYESLIFEYFEHKTIISEIDREFIFHVDRKKIEIIENGIDEKFFDVNSKWENQCNVLFTGNMSYPPNIKAAEFIAKSIAPELSSFNFLISGANSDKLSFGKISENVKQTGWVEDIRVVYRDAKIFIAPMFIGTGVQNKLLEAMAMSLPCITTDLGNKPLGAKVGEEILVANSKDEFIEQIQQLFEDKELYEKISENGRRFVQNHFNWNKSTQKLIDIMNK
ncbi:MAG: glycosyltransferase [Crocinitomicaceae bacterium]|nr:glycosyltransferase [Crocinitomicaceae bacterium]